MRMWKSFTALNAVLPGNHNEAKARLLKSVMITSECKEQHVYYVLFRQAVKPVSMGRAGEKTWRVSFLSKEDLLAFVRAGPHLAIDKYTVNIKKEVFHYEVRIPPVLGFA